MANPNDKILDREIKHALSMRATANKIARQVLAALNRYDKDIEDQLAGGIARALRAREKRGAIESLLAAFYRLNEQAVRAAFKVLIRSLKAFVGVEAAYFVQLLGEAVGRALQTPETASLTKAVGGMLVLGETTEEQIARVIAYRAKLVTQAVRTGVLGGQTVDEILAALREPRGAIEAGRQAVETIAHTHVPTAAQVARNQVYRANLTAAIGQFWSSILDNRTTMVCRKNDGATRELTPDQVEQFERTGFASPGGFDADGPFDGIEWSNGYNGPYPAHLGERSLLVPYVAGGKIPDKFTWEEWFRRQSAVVQEQLLGPSRYALWKSGRYSLRDFVTDRGRTLTLAELRAKDAAMFDEVVEEAEASA